MSKFANYKDLKIEKQEVELVSEEELNSSLQAFVTQSVTLEVMDKEAELGDVVNIDFEGFVDGVAFEGGKGENYDLVIGSHSFIPGFEEQLIGMKAEETKDIKVTFPENYHAENLKGKEATFTVTVHEIKKKVLPELNDEFVKELKYENVNTVEELRNYTKDNLAKRKEDQAKADAETALLDKLAEIVEVEIPEPMVKSELDSMVQNYESRLMQQGISLAQFLQLTGQKIEDLRETMKDDAKKRIKLNLGLDEIAKKENVEATEEDINNEYQRLADMYGMSVEDIKKYVPENTLKDDVRLQKTLELLKK